MQASPLKPKNPSVTTQASRSPHLPKNLDLEISHEAFAAGLEDIPEIGGSTFIDLESSDGSITLQLNISRSADGNLSLNQAGFFEMDGENIEAQVRPLPAGDGGYQITAKGRTFYFYGGRDAGQYWVNQGYLDLLGPNPHSGEELRIAHAITHTRGDTGPIRKLLQIEIDRRPLPANLRLMGSLPIKDVRNRKPFILRDQGYHLALPSELRRGSKPGEIIVTFFDPNSGEHVVTLHGPKGFTRKLEFLTEHVTKRSSINLNGVPLYLDVRLNGKDVHVRLDPSGTQNIVFVPGQDVISDLKKLKAETGVVGTLNRLASDDSGSTSVDFDAHMTQTEAHGFSPSSPKAFCTFANLGLATLTGIGVDYLFNHGEKNGEYQSQVEVGAWRHVATALTTSYASSRFFSGGRISMTQALGSYAKGMLTSLPIDFGFNTTSFGSSPFGFAASFLANHFGDNVFDALIGRNPFTQRLATTAGLALFLGSTAYSYYNETHHSKPN